MVGSRGFPRHPRAIRADLYLRTEKRGVSAVLWGRRYIFLAKAECRSAPVTRTRRGVLAFRSPAEALYLRLAPRAYASFRVLVVADQGGRVVSSTAFPGL